MSISCSLSHLLAAGARRLLAAGIPGDEARAEARILLTHALNIPPEELRLRPEREVTGDDAARYEAAIARREQREPLAYITGTRAFYGLDFLVTPAVLIPRPETEFVVEAVLRYVQGSSPDAGPPRIADVGTGSGCIAVAVAVNAPHARVFASDLSADALAVARQNAERHGVSDRLTFVEGDFLAPLTVFAPFAVIASNPPYVAVEEIEKLAPEVREWEPRIALGTHADALHFYRRFADEAPALLAPGGLLAVEVGQGQAESVVEMWRGAGWVTVATTQDYAGIPRVVMGTAPAIAPSSGMPIPLP